MTLLPLLLAVRVQAEQAPPDYREEVVRRASAVAEAFNAEGRFEEAARWGARFQRQVTEAADVEYEVAYAWNRLGRADRARRHYRRVLDLDPEHAAAWYDLGELCLSEGDLDEAEDAFGHAAALRPDHWAGPFRLAEVAARRGDAAAFETHLREALRDGFSFRVVLGDPHWSEYYRDPDLCEVIRRLVTVYSDERILRVFEAGEGPR